jgi:hypothetical protein
LGQKYPTILALVILPDYIAYEDGTDSVPKRRHIKFRRRGTTQKKEHNIHKTEKVSNQMECKLHIVIEYPKERR